MTATEYRWNTSAAAAAYDEAAPTIHPHYVTVQDEILRRLPFASDEPFTIVDMGGGSGRLMARILDRFVAAQGVVVDQSEPFLALAERRLRPFGPQARIVQRRLQNNWAAELPNAPNAIVSTSAIHHLEPEEKRALFGRIFAALAPGGMFINGDEHRPVSDAEFRGLLEKWSKHMFSALDEGRIPESFRATIDQWRSRNIDRFGEPKKSGDDCLETIEAQLAYLRDAGFAPAEATWAEDLWAVVVAEKPQA
jgi:cyclopropane fatty-acyl-phospholipid synthase-like methyltransferase